MRSPEHEAPASAAAGTSTATRQQQRQLIGRINALNVAMAEGSSSASAAPPLSPATGANALPASPPVDRLALPPISRFSPSASTGQGTLDMVRLGFESPSELAARGGKGATSTTQQIMDEPLFAHESDRNFPVPKYLDHSVWRSRMFTFPSPLRSPLTARMATVASSATRYSIGAPAAERQPAAARKSQLAASLTGGPSGSDDWTIPLPTCWDQEDRCTLVEVSGDGLEVSFCGTGKNGDRDAAAVRANRHMPPHTGIYYYEVEIVSKGQSGYIAIGFSGLNVALSRLPGWETNSWGYHGDDGHAFASQGTGKAYGPTFSTGDVVGCGIDFTQQRAFFTKNGAFLGYTFENLEGQLYPSVGMRTPGEVVRANFGQQPFRFDIDQLVIGRQLKVLRSIEQSTVPESYCLPAATEIEGLPSEEGSEGRLDETVASLVSAYLTFHGFVDTAHAFETQRAANQRRYVDLSAPSTSALPLTNGDVEMMDASSSTGGMGVRQRICRAVSAGQTSLALAEIEEAFPDASSTMSDALFHLRCQHFIELLLAPLQRKAKDRSASPSSAALDEALAYGQQLDASYAADARPSVKEGLRKAFAVLAYDDPRRADDAEVAWLASQAARDKLADELNAAILDAQGHSARPVLETVFKQACVSVTELGRLGHGGAALVDVASEAMRF